MSADRLRKAAWKIRDTTQDATPGPWVWYPYGESGATLARPSERFHDFNILKTTSDWPPNAVDAAHIAMWSPPVALAVAYWLDDYASWLDANDLVAGGNAPALRLANAILGGTS